MGPNSVRARLRQASSNVLLALLAVSPCVLAQQAEQPAAAPAVAGSSSTDDLRRLMEAHQLTELRTTYNGTYGASLLFQADKLSYYVALFHDKAFWRVIQTDSADEADKIYRSFAAQTEQLAQADIDNIRLQASKAYTDHLIALNQQRLQNLQQDSERLRQKTQQVAAAQQQAQQQEAALTSGLNASNGQLDQVRQRIQALQAQQNDPALPLALPATASSAAPAATPAATPPAATRPAAAPAKGQHGARKGHRHKKKAARKAPAKGSVEQAPAAPSAPIKPIGS
jgi:hypothetical protein